MKQNLVLPNYIICVFVKHYSLFSTYNFNVSKCELLDDGKWTLCENTPESQWGGRAVAVSQQSVLVIGGRNEKGEASKSVMRFVRKVLKVLIQIVCT